MYFKTKLPLSQRGFKVLKAHKSGRFHNKRLIENFFVATAATYIRPGKCLKLTGIDCGHYVKTMFSTIATELSIVENEAELFRRIFEKVSRFPEFPDRISLHFDDALNVSVNGCVYIDLDIMHNMNEVVPVVKNHVATQRNTVKGLKAISFTANVRKGGTSAERFYHLKKMLMEEFNADITGFNGEMGDFGDKSKDIVLPESFTRKGVYARLKRADFKSMGDIIDFQFVNYSDTSPYITALVVYK